jgi:hypothetical protein
MAFAKPSTLLFRSLIAISGTVSNLQTELLEYVNPEKPSNDDASAYYQRFYVSIFNLDKHKIEAKFSSPIKMRDGDIVSVSGHYKNNRFEVLAYRNQTQQIMHAEKWVAMGFGSLFCMAVAIGLLISELALEDAVIPKLFLLGFGAVGIYMGYRALYIRKAIHLLQGK